MATRVPRPEDPILTHVRRDVPLLSRNQTLGDALDEIRRHGLGDRIVYFYVVDENDRLIGVLPARRLLTAAPEEKVSAGMIERVTAIPATATVLEACEFFVLHRFLAFPVVDEERHVLGVVDIGLFTEEILDLADRSRVEEAFETIGLRIAEVQGASALGAFRLRFPWLLATAVSGTICAALIGLFEGALARHLVMALFLALALGLGESVSIQSLALASQALRARRPTPRGYLRALSQELSTALLLGGAYALAVGGVVLAWQRSGPAALGIAAGIGAALVSACFWGLSVPFALHALRLDPKIAAGPVTLALADISTILLYFWIGFAFLERSAGVG